MAPESHVGEYWKGGSRDEPGKGGQFHFTGRFGIAGQPEPLLLVSYAPPAPDGARILIVDDEISSRRILKDATSRCAAWVTAGGVAAAGSLVETRIRQVVFMALRLPVQQPPLPHALVPLHRPPHP
jgi:hypothetical protein